MKIYGIKNCGSVKKALDILNANNKEYEFIDFKKSTVDQTKINEWLTKTTLKILLNKQGTTYKKLNLKDKNLTEEEAIEYLSKENMLMKRPIIECDDGSLIVGLDEDVIKKL